MSGKPYCPEHCAICYREPTPEPIKVVYKFKKACGRVSLDILAGDR